MSNKYEPPKPVPGDRVYAVVRAGLGSIPVVGASAVELLQQVLEPPIEQRRTEWMASVGEALLLLESERGVKIEDLGNNQAFVDAVLTASQVAIRTSQKNKRRALRNAVLNSALPTSPDITRQQIYLSLIDRLTDLHLSVLRFFQGPKNWKASDGRQVSSRNTGDAGDVLSAAHPELAGHGALCDVVWTELYAAGLVDIATLHNKYEGDAVMKKRTTQFGDDFLAFIASPVSA
jgi:hypothetical protein